MSLLVWSAAMKPVTSVELSSLAGVSFFLLFQVVGCEYNRLTRYTQLQCLYLRLESLDTFRPRS